jgi:hypothetical protein
MGKMGKMQNGKKGYLCGAICGGGGGLFVFSFVVVGALGRGVLGHSQK